MAAVLVPRTTDLDVPAPRRPELRLIPGARPSAARTAPRQHRPGRQRVRPVPAPRPPAAAASASTYRRRRFVAALVAATLVVATGLALSRLGTDPPAAALITTGSGATSAVATPATQVAAAPAVYVVRPGDTLWAIARHLQPEGDIRPLVDELSARAGGAGLQAGQRLVLDGLTG
jgi:LysM repeat protein